MHRRLPVLSVLLLALALPLSASQFIDLPFDQVARESSLIVRGSIVNTWSAWDDAHEMIYTYATVRVQRYFGEATGPDTLVVREVGGTVDGYTMEAVGFPMVRSNEEVVLFLAPWDDGGAELRIHAFNQGKFLVRNRGGKEFAVADPVHQGEAREGRSRIEVNSLDDDSPALSIDELAGMIEAARAGVSRTTDFQTDRQ